MSGRSAPGRTLVFLQRVLAPSRKLAVRVCVSSLNTASPSFVLLAILAGEGGAAGQGSECPCEVLYLGRHDEELARRSLRHLGEGLQVEVAERLGREVGALQPLEELARHLDLGRLDVTVGFGLAFGAQYGGPLLAFSTEDRGLLLAFRFQDRGPLVAFCGQDRSAAGPLGLHLLLHRLLDISGGDDLFELHPRHPDAPLLRYLVEDRAQLRVDLIAGGQGLVQDEVADHVAQGGLGDLLQRQVEVGDLVLGGPRVDNLVVDDGRDLHPDVVVGDDRLRLEGHDLFPQVRFGQHAIHHRDDQGKTALGGAVVASETLHYGYPALRDDPDTPRRHQKDHERQYRQPYKTGHNLSSFVSTVSTRAVSPSVSSTITLLPRSIFSSGCRERAVQNSPLPTRTIPFPPASISSVTTALLPVIPRCPRYPSPPLSERRFKTAGRRITMLSIEAARNPTPWTARGR